MPPKRGRKRKASVSPSIRATPVSVSHTPPPPTDNGTALASPVGRDMTAAMRVPRYIIEQGIRDTKAKEDKQRQEDESRQKELTFMMRIALENLLFSPDRVAPLTKMVYDAESDQLFIEWMAALPDVQRAVQYFSKKDWWVVLQNTRTVVPEHWTIAITVDDLNSDVPQTHEQLARLLAYSNSMTVVTFHASGPRSKIEI